MLGTAADRMLPTVLLIDDDLVSREVFRVLIVPIKLNSIAQHSKGIATYIRCHWDEGWDQSYGSRDVRSHYDSPGGAGMAPTLLCRINGGAHRQLAARWYGWPPAGLGGPA